MRVFPLLLMLWPAVAGAQLLEEAEGTKPSFVSARYQFGTPGTVETGSVGEPITASGPSLTVDLGDGTALVSPADTAAVGPAGAPIHGARVSRIAFNQRSSSDNSASGICGSGSTWTVRGVATCTGPVEAPDGSMTAERIVVGADGVDDIYSYSAGVFAPDVQLGNAIWVRRVSTDKTLGLKNIWSYTRGRWSVSLSALGDGWVRLTRDSAGVTVLNAFQAFTNGGGGLALYSPDGPAELEVWRPWQQEGQIVGPDAEVGALALSVGATTIQVPHGLCAGDDCLRTPDPFCVSVRATTHWGLDGQGVIQIGTGDNTFSIYIGTSPGRAVAVQIKDGTAANRAIYRTGVLADETSEKVIVGCYVGDGSARIAVDGGELTGLTTAGSGTGVMTALEPFSKLGLGNDNALSLNGAAKSVIFCRGTSNPRDCR